MSISLAERRQIENEMIFRRRNEKVGEALDKIDAMHVEDGNLQLIKDEDFVLHFICECSDEDCKERIPLLLSKYQEIHKDRDTFILRVGHQVEPIEEIIHTEPEYIVVRKNVRIAEPAGGLNDTPIDNT